MNDSDTVQVIEGPASFDSIDETKSNLTSTPVSIVQGQVVLAVESDEEKEEQSVSEKQKEKGVQRIEKPPWPPVSIGVKPDEDDTEDESIDVTVDPIEKKTVINENNKTWLSHLANPAPLGLAAFGMTTFLLNAHNAKWFADFDSMIFGMGIIFGGAAQMIVGVLEFFKNNTFGFVAFTSYGAFWISLCILKIFPETLGVPGANAISMFLYLLIWGIFTSCMTIGTCKGKKVATLSLVFIMLSILFFILALENLVKYIIEETGGGDNTAVTVLSIIAGVWGMILGLLALYLGMAEIMNEKYERVVFPIIFPGDLKLMCGGCRYRRGGLKNKLQIGGKV